MHIIMKNCRQYRHHHRHRHDEYHHESMSHTATISSTPHRLHHIFASVALSIRLKTQKHLSWIFTKFLAVDALRRECISLCGVCGHRHCCPSDRRTCFHSNTLKVSDTYGYPTINVPQWGIPLREIPTHIEHHYSVQYRQLIRLW